MKDYLLLHAYFAFNTFSTESVHIVKYLLKQYLAVFLFCVT